MKPIQWAGGVVKILDQTRLPDAEVWIEVRTANEMAAAIRDMKIRGAPNIGIAAAFGMALASAGTDPTPDSIERAAKLLSEARPTAVNLRWALDRMMMRYEADGANSLLDEANAIAALEEQNCERIADNGLPLVPPNAGILTICNSGMLAAYGIGTAYGVILRAHQAGKKPFVWACETRPRAQGLKLTAWELQRDGIPFKVIADGAAGSLMASGKVQLVITGADRIAANGDAANKIGTYSLAVLALHHRTPFYVGAPTSTIDKAISDGTKIPIEERDPIEISGLEKGTGTAGMEPVPFSEPVPFPHAHTARASPLFPAYNPAFDVTPAALITAILTETGVHKPPFRF